MQHGSPRTPAKGFLSSGGRVLQQSFLVACLGGWTIEENQVIVILGDMVGGVGRVGRVG